MKFHGTKVVVERILILILADIEPPTLDDTCMSYSAVHFRLLCNANFPKLASIHWPFQKSLTAEKKQTKPTHIPVGGYWNTSRTKRGATDTDCYG